MRHCELSSAVSLATDEAVQSVEDGAFHLNVRFCPIHHATATATGSRCATRSPSTVGARARAGSTGAL